MSVLYWLESIRNPFLDALMQFFTYFGEELLFIVLALTVFWCVDKREGYYLLFVGFFGTILNQFLKLLYRIPRPWVKDPTFQPVDSALSGATGYSFPSGHTQNVTGTLGGIARWSKRTGVRVLCVVVLLLTAFSRMYLGVHTPLDVGVSLAIGVVLVFVFYPIVRKAAENPNYMAVLLGIMVALSFAFVLYANLWAPPAQDAEALNNLREGQKNSYSLFGALLGFCVAYPLERCFIRFEEKSVWWVQVIKVVGGLAGLLVIKEGLKLVFSAVGFTWLGTNAIRYFAVVLFAALVWPLVFPPLNRLASGRKAK
ncbi:MAG: phosphatase PAP2 family protein [Faecousia sp.]